jgi:hypothetical protein
MIFQPKYLTNLKKRTLPVPNIFQGIFLCNQIGHPSEGAVENMAIISRKFLAKSGLKARYKAQSLYHPSIFFCYILKTKCKNQVYFHLFPHFWQLKLSKIIPFSKFKFWQSFTSES